MALRTAAAASNTIPGQKAEASGTDSGDAAGTAAHDSTVVTDAVTDMLPCSCASVMPADKYKPPPSSGICSPLVTAMRPVE